MEAEAPMTGGQLKRFIHLSGISQARMAVAIDVSPRTLRRWLTLKKVPKIAEYSIRWAHQETDVCRRS